MKTTLTNEFHNTEVVVRTDADLTLSHTQVVRARRILCGMSDCTCGDVAGARPQQVLQLSQGRTMAENQYRIYELQEVSA